MSSPVAKYGQLSVKGSSIVDQYGEPVALKGVSSHGLQWFGHLVTRESLQDLRDNWGIEIFRAAMYTAEGGYMSNQGVKGKVHEIAEWCKELGLYVIIDWHILRDNNPQQYQWDAINFFKEMAEKYVGVPNVIYEICNEPNGNVSWWGNVRPYAVDVVRSIREIDPANLIMVGSPNWSQNFHEAADSPIDGGNIAYTCHFYAGSHQQWLRDRIDYAMGRGVAIYVSEWGTTEASGNGHLYLDEAERWMQFLAQRKIGWCNWSYSTAGESSALLYGNKQISTSGLFVKNHLQY